LSYEVILMPAAQKDLDGFRGKLLARFETLILGLADNARPRHSKKLSGGGSRYRIRTGDYRILYEVEEKAKQVRVYRIAHRKAVYR
jgi:mRNA interferase RelE/StbE